MLHADRARGEYVLRTADALAELEFPWRTAFVLGIGADVRLLHADPVSSVVVRLTNKMPFRLPPAAINAVSAEVQAGYTVALFAVVVPEDHDSCDSEQLMHDTHHRALVLRAQHMFRHFAQRVLSLCICACLPSEIYMMILKDYILCVW